MTKVKNGKVIRKLAARELGKNKKLNVVVILSIVLTCLLFTTLATIGGSLMNGMQEETMRQVGARSMMGFKEALPEDYELLSTAKGIKNLSYNVMVGEGYNSEFKEISLEIRYAGSDQAAKDMFSYPTEGRLPEKENEIAMSDIALRTLGFEPKLGQEIHLVINTDGKITEHDLTLCGWWQGDPINLAQQSWVSPELGKKIAPLRKKGDDSVGVCGYMAVNFDFESSYDIEGQAAELISSLYEKEDLGRMAKQTGINWAYVGSSVDSGFVVAGSAFVLLIFFAGYLIIYNIFYINTSANIRSYGLLKTIGTTSRQLKRMVRIQACIYCLVGIPLGLVTGVLAGKGLMGFIMNTMNVVSRDSYSVSGRLLCMICLFAALFTFLTVMISCRKPCRMAGAVSPIEALRYNETDISTKKTDKKTGRITPLAVARNNMSRSRKKTVVVVLSLTLSIVLVNTMFTLLGGIDQDKYIADSIVGDINITHDDRGDNWNELTKGITPDIIDRFSSIEGCEVHPAYYEAGMVRDDGAHTEKVQGLLDKYGSTDEDTAVILEASVKDKSHSSNIYGIDEEILSCIEPSAGSIDLEKFRNGRYAIVSTYLYCADDENSVQIYQPGDKITVDYADKGAREYEVLAVAPMPYPISVKAYNFFQTDIIVPEEEYFAADDEPAAVSLMINTDDNDGSAAEQCSAVCDEDGSPLIYKDKADYLKEFEDLLNMVKMVGGTLSGILALIGILNFVNAVVTGILSRKRELAMMNAVGMTSSQQKAMLRWEGACYAVLTAVCSAVLAALVSLLAVKGLGEGLFFFRYHFTLLPLICCIPVLLALSAAIPSVAYKFICRESVVERLRENG
ncbi:FtsX-like permease family protein [Ruminococcus sp.]|uniref:ABC transporter permease n=1 Tax=Ruminococcus sp. TaxID=41978 RepID=UPI0025E19D3B|nr:FtsX-like permease family protein [Ruminococcus sp.]MBQ8966279.1 FtsX-like permease family protein [Ruminococcus sp.]